MVSPVIGKASTNPTVSPFSFVDKQALINTHHPIPKNIADIDAPTYPAFISFFQTKTERKKEREKKREKKREKERRGTRRRKKKEKKRKKRRLLNVMDWD